MAFLSSPIIIQTANAVKNDQGLTSRPCLLRRMQVVLIRVSTGPLPGEAFLFTTGVCIRAITGSGSRYLRGLIPTRKNLYWQATACYLFRSEQLGSGIGDKLPYHPVCGRLADGSRGGSATG